MLCKNYDTERLASNTHSDNQSNSQIYPKLPSSKLSTNSLISTSSNYIQQESQHIETCQLHPVSQSVKQSIGQARLPSCQLSTDILISTSSNYARITTQTRLAYNILSVKQSNSQSVNPYSLPVNRQSIAKFQPISYVLHKKHITHIQSISQTVNRSIHTPFLSTLNLYTNYNLILICLIRIILHPVNLSNTQSINQSNSQIYLNSLPINCQSIS